MAKVFLLSKQICKCPNVRKDFHEFHIINNGIFIISIL